LKEPKWKMTSRIVILFILQFVFFDLAWQFKPDEVWFWVFLAFNMASIGLIVLNIEQIFRKTQSQPKQPKYDFRNATPGLMIGIITFAIIGLVSAFVGLIKLIEALRLDAFQWQVLLWWIPALMYLAVLQMFRKKK